MTCIKKKKAFSHEFPLFLKHQILMPLRLRNLRDVCPSSLLATSPVPDHLHRPNSSDLRPDIPPFLPDHFGILAGHFNHTLLLWHLLQS